MVSPSKGSYLPVGLLHDIPVVISVVVDYSARFCSIWPVHNKGRCVCVSMYVSCNSTTLHVPLLQL